MQNRRLTLIVALLVLVFALSGCTSYDQQVFEEVSDLLNEEWDKESQLLKQTVAAKFATLSANPQEKVESVFGTMIAGEPEGPFNSPTFGYIGMEYRELYPDTGLPHSGLDIWASKDRTNGGQLGNPVYAVYDGKLGLTGSGVEICHPRLDTTRYPDLPFSLVCTYYGHLTDLPEKFAGLRKDHCPTDMVDVNQGDLLGYMDNKDMVSNSGIVHLHFSVVQQNPQNGCWTNEMLIANTISPLVYLGFADKSYGWLDLFP